ncbi:DeoR/GlpR family DNA-binding transcription regulator [Labedella endophytica]|uniref:DeoR/GlpR transcriptional regulator n=1 Tax=Labedella endophytica TaxID=1523160 RepID=A0A3S0X123_9MICO|nr:DeoR/GlpR family DNA-binding transcription regulator [Labedella endophytica]RUR03409.1 DeoR/GlpR transcriptional regulator [Labedella endophytica]
MSDPVETPLPADMRRARILEIVRDRGFVRVSDLGGSFGVSDVTVRGDLDALAATGSVRRVHGGAVAALGPVAEPSFEQASDAFAGEKRAIGRAAAALVSSGQSIFLDVGTTANAVAVALAERDDLTDVVVMTNGLNIALALEATIPRFTVLVTGGALRPLQHSLVNPMALRLLDGLHADLAIIGCNGVHPEAGVTNVNLPEAEVKRAMVERAGRTVVVADGSKLGNVHLGRIARLAEVDVLITSASAPAGALDEFAALDLSVTQV